MAHLLGGFVGVPSGWGAVVVDVVAICWERTFARVLVVAVVVVIDLMIGMQLCVTTGKGY